MKIYFGLIITLILTSFLLFGCTSNDLSTIAKLDPSVQQFLNEHPNAEIKVTLMNSEQMELMSDTIKLQCEINLPKTDHYYIRVIDKETNLELYVWMNASTKQADCVYKKGSQVTPPIDQNKPTTPTDQNQMNPPVDQNQITPTPDQNNVIVQPDVERVKVGNVYLSIAEISLNDYGTKVDSVKFRIDNETDVEQDISKKVSINIKNSVGELVDSSKYENSLSVSDIKEIQFKTISPSLNNTLSPGKYEVEIGIYNDGSTTTSTYLTKEINIGSDSDRKIIYPRKIESFTPTDSVKLGQLELFVEQINLNSYGTKIDSMRLRFENVSDVEQSISKNVSILMLNNKNEIVDVSTAYNSISLSDIKEIQFKTINPSINNTLPPGDYTTLIKVYNSNSAKSNIYISKSIKIGPDELQTIEYPKKVKVYAQTAGEITKATLNSYGTTVSKYSYKVGETVLSGKNIFTMMLNDKNEIVDAGVFNTTIQTSDIVNNLLNNKYPHLNRTLKNGEYTLLAQIYNSGSSVPGYVLAKKITISPDAPKEQ